MLSYTDHLFLLINSIVVYLNYSSIPAWAELCPAQPQLVSLLSHSKLTLNPNCVNIEQRSSKIKVLIKFQWMVPMSMLILITA